MYRKYVPSAYGRTRGVVLTRMMNPEKKSSKVVDKASNPSRGAAQE